MIRGATKQLDDKEAEMLNKFNEYETVKNEYGKMKNGLPKVIEKQRKNAKDYMEKLPSESGKASATKAFIQFLDRTKASLPKWSASLSI